MKAVLKWLGYAAAFSVALALAATLYVFLATQPMLNKTYDQQLTTIAVPHDDESIAEGKRLARIRGCFDGCHGNGLDGGYVFDDGWISRFVSPNLTQVAASHSDAELERVIRHGVRKNGKSVWFMPSTMFYHLNDEDLGKIIAFIRSVPVTDGPATESWIGPRWRLDLLQDRYLPQAEEIRRDAPWIRDDMEPAERNRGRYLALTVCSECHGMKLQGDIEGSTPNLAIVAAYSEADFFKLMRTATPLSGRKLGLMGEVARSRFVHFTDDEIRDLYGYLHSLGGT